nr:MAG TPA: hypothetical protein [Caudoviricetes sp.]
MFLHFEGKRILKVIFIFALLRCVLYFCEPKVQSFLSWFFIFLFPYNNY